MDDDQDLRELIAFDFDSAGCETLTAKNGTEALAILASKEVDAVVSDIRMPDGDGVSVYERAKKLRKSGKPVFIFISGFSDLTAEEAYGRGAEGFFTKPFGRRVLVSAVDRLLLPPAARWVPKAPADKAPPIKSELGMKIGSLKSAAEENQLVIGRGGMFVALNAPFPALGELIRFVVTIGSGSQIISGSGWVRWIRAERSQRPTGIGVEFSTLDESSIELVESHQNSNPTDAFIPRS
ncbi:MAG: response regulator [Bdellovibrionota bacterium]